MAFETKVLLNAIYDIIVTSKSLEEARERFVRVANAENVINDKNEK